METSQLVEIEPYEEIVGTFYNSMPRIGQSYSSDNARVQSTSQEPMPVFGGTEAIPACYHAVRTYPAVHPETQ